ncbi:hypothetical protein CLAFUW4_10814 [Fulvia fulva]|uniref:Uncharacterized protein n=1 Tax=Passalora fulva TaxID=5499 RepID=A0A9Q8PD43_PASFU|nr:uncharacterized protein CLAFUR5_09858 [Fulvia fulva]KAK4619849.1 hypothetical protein CLAFUR4_10819 [Fulvia fulva]KAK4620480.1 hypothetical protein CLAFUR0_10826 [Fulvia fulva]UJO20236.1 hypothetical protein CLAFUR5_09858 [Fulvia fulva]WPV17217.1 hypothetical protein CLAFUW4_10814 [Fulvia fulva]WPV31919.1 hypothetical protein CLAFUW7_10812 [Fulvia fulva]
MLNTTTTNDRDYPEIDIISKGKNLLLQLQNLIELIKMTTGIENGAPLVRLVYELGKVIEAKKNTGNAAQALIDQAEGILSSDWVKQICDEAEGRLQSWETNLAVVRGRERN